MNAKHERLKEILAEAAAKGSPAERAAYLDGACRGDPGLRAQVEALLGAHDDARGFLADPVVTLPQQTIFVPPLTEKPGDRIGRYKLLQQIGEGGCGVVYMAEQEEPVRRRVAFKVIKQGMDTKSVIARFEAERQALAMMDHPNIAKVLDAGATDTGRPYFVMELVRGIRITDYCDQNNLSTRERLDLFVQVCHAIQHAHQKGIIHRDIKPSNILVSLHDGVPMPLVIDFGVAKAMEQKLTEKTLFTAFEQFIGTPAYTSPEQAEMSRLDIDTRSDIYALGVLLYELLTGKTPFDAKTLVSAGLEAMRRMIREQEPARPSTRLSTMVEGELTTTAQRRQVDPPRLIHLVRGDLDWIVMKCLEKDRTRRYETANGVAQDIERHLKHEPVLARPPSVGYRLQKSFQRNKLVFTAAGLVGMTLVLGVVVSSWQAVRATKAGQREAAARVRADEAARVADSEKQRAEKEAQKAKESELAARRNLYAADMVLAQQAVAEGNLGHAQKLLSKYDSNDQRSPALTTGLRSTEARDLRDWEWRYLWQQTRSDELYTLGSHHGGCGVTEVVFAPDGQRLASRSQLGPVILWDLEKKQSIAGWSDSTNGVSAIGFSKDGRTLAVANYAGRAVKFFDTTTGREQVEPLLFTAPVWQLAFSPDGKTLLVSAGQELVMLNAATRAERLRTQVPWGFAWRMTFSPDGSTVAILTDCRDVILWNLANQSQIAKLTGLEFLVAGSLAFSPDGRLLACACMTSPRALIWDVETKQVIKTLETTSRWIAGVAFSPDGQTVAMVTDDQAVTIFDRASWQKVKRLKGHLDEAWCVAFSPDGRLLMSGAKDDTIRAWSAAVGGPGEDLVSLPPETDAVELSADGKTLVTLTTNNTFTLWDTTAMRRTVTKPLPLLSFVHHGGFWLYPTFAISSGGKLLAIPQPDGTISVWETDTLREAARLEGFTRPAQVVTLSRDDKTLTAACENTVKLWDLDTRKPLASFSNLVTQVSSLLHSPEHKLLIAGYSGGQAQVWDLGHQWSRRLGLGSGFMIAALAISPDGGTLAMGGTSASLQLWDIRSDRLIDTIGGQRNAYTALVISRDGRRIVAGGADGTIRIWDSETHQVVAVLPAHNRVLRMAFLPDKNTLVSVGLDALRAWRAPTLNEIDTDTKLHEQQRDKRVRVWEGHLSVP
jgi:eukaryotic-like serine/threonine-protein kinase